MGLHNQMALLPEAIAILWQENVATTVFGVFLLGHKEGYMRGDSIMNHRSVDIFAVVAITLVAAVLALLVPPNIVPIRIVTLPLVLVLPGYALTSALFPNRSLGVAERLVFSLSLSLIIVILGGLALNWTPFGLRPGSWAVLLSGITLAAGAVALVRRRGQDIFTSGW